MAPVTRYFEYKYKYSNKFWEISYNPDDTSFSYRVRWGKIGAGGTGKLKNCTNLSNLRYMVDKLCREKIGKGYKEIQKAMPVTPVVPEKIEPPRINYLELDWD